MNQNIDRKVVSYQTVVSAKQGAEWQLPDGWLTNSNIMAALNTRRELVQQLHCRCLATGLFIPLTLSV